MSIIFKPKIPEFFADAPKPKAKEPKVAKKRKGARSWISIELSKSRTNRGSEWSPQELNILVDLRALAVPTLDCARLLKRSTVATRACIHTYDLYAAIKSKRKLQVKEVLLNA